MSTTTRFAQRDTARLAYAISRRESDAAVPAIALLHDLLADRRAFAHQRQHDAGIAAVLLLPDARGHGASAALANQRFTVPELAADLLAILDAEAINHIHLVGHGLGGATALALARFQPKRIASLTLIEPTLPAVLEDAAITAPAAILIRDTARDAARAAIDAATKDLPDRALDLLLAPRWGVNWRTNLPKPRYAAIRRHAAALSGILAALTSYGVPTSALATLTIPTTLILTATPTPLVHLIVERLAATIPNAQTLTLPPGDTLDPLSGEPGDVLNAHLRVTLSES